MFPNALFRSGEKVRAVKHAGQPFRLGIRTLRKALKWLRKFHASFVLSWNLILTLWLKVRI